MIPLNSSMKMRNSNRTVRYSKYSTVVWCLIYNLISSIYLIITDQSKSTNKKTKVRLKSLILKKYNKYEIRQWCSVTINSLF